MTPFELWQVGRGEEPAVNAYREGLRFDVIRDSGRDIQEPWKWRYLDTWYANPVAWYRSHEAGEREESAAAEECRAALAAAMFSGDVARAAIERGIRCHSRLAGGALKDGRDAEARKVYDIADGLRIALRQIENTQHLPVKEDFPCEP